MKNRRKQIETTMCFEKLQRRAENGIYNNYRRDLQKLAKAKNCKAITASDVVISTRKCNGVTNLLLPFFKICRFLFDNKRSLTLTHNTMCQYVFYISYDSSLS